MEFQLQELKLVQTPMESDEEKPKIPSLPQELITAILVRLPVKYILQCKCVSKYWLSLISSPEFVKSHLSFSAKDQRFMLLNYVESIVKYCSVSSLFNNNCNVFDLDYPLEKPYDFVKIAGSVNGLICLGYEGDRLILWNPSTRKIKQVPDIMPPDACYMFKYGFGYDELNDDYKVVAINCSVFVTFGKIYSLKTDSWRELDVYECWVQYSNSAKLVNMKLHCVTADRFNTSAGDCWGIMSVDLADEKCGKVELPDYEGGEKELFLGVLGSDLSMICNHISKGRKTRMDLWVMKEYGVKESWTKLYSVQYSSQPTYIVTCPPFCMSNKGESVFLLGQDVMIYNQEKKSIRYPKFISAYGNVEAELYIESLVCPILQNEPSTQH